MITTINLDTRDITPRLYKKYGAIGYEIVILRDPSVRVTFERECDALQFLIDNCGFLEEEGHTLEDYII